MVKDHADSEKGNPLPPYRLLLSINSKGSFYMHHPTYRIPHTTAFVTPVVEHWLEREITIETTKVKIDGYLHCLVLINSVHFFKTCLFRSRFILASRIIIMVHPYQQIS